MGVISISLINTLLNNNPQGDPLHYGEIFGSWQHLMQAKGCFTKYQLLKNHTNDNELRSFLNEMMDDVIKPEIPKLESILKQNGIMPPPSRPDKPPAEAERIPVGARFTEEEISMCIQHDLVTALTSCTQIISITTRKDIGKIFATHQAEIILMASVLLDLMKAKGWLIVPPLHTDIPANQE